MIVSRIFYACQSILQGVAAAAMAVVEAALAGARWFGDRAREWEPRLWDRDHDPRSDERNRWP